MRAPLTGLVLLAVVFTPLAAAAGTPPDRVVSLRDLVTRAEAAVVSEGAELASPVAGNRLVVRATPGCSGGLVHDDGSFENAYAPSGSAVDGSFVMLMDRPPASGNLLDQVCVCWTRTPGSTDDDIDHDLVIFDNDGPGGSPGTEWERIAATASGVPEFPAAPFFQYDLSSLGVTLPPGDFYLGVGGWDRTVDGDVFLCGDEDGLGGQPGYFSGGGSNWTELGTPTNAPDYKALGVRADVEQACVPSDTVLCLSDNRFRVELEWLAPNGASGPGRVVPFGSDDSGLFYFNNPDNWEMLVKVIDACVPAFNRYWVFFAATTNVEFTLTVTDTTSGQLKSYFNPLRNPAAPIQDTDAFATCP